MKNRPLLLVGLTAALCLWVLYQTLEDSEDIRQDPTGSLAVIGIFALILVPVLWFQYYRLKREPIYVEVKDRERGVPPDPRLSDSPLVLVASRTKILGLLTVAMLSFGFVAFMMWRQPGVCREVGLASFAPFIVLTLVMSIVGLLKPERLEITSQGLKHVSFWSSRHWSWDEIRNITLIRHLLQSLCLRTLIVRPFAHPAQPHLAHSRGRLGESLE